VRRTTDDGFSRGLGSVGRRTTGAPDDGFSRGLGSVGIAGRRVRRTTDDGRRTTHDGRRVLQICTERDFGERERSSF
jgi:hypothetical protein